MTRCKPLPLALLAVGLACGAAWAENPAGDKAPQFEQVYGSTIVSTYPDGKEAELWLQRDGSWSGTSRKLQPNDGIWQVRGDKLCLKQHHPFSVPFFFCTPMPGDISHPWEGKAPTGEKITIRVVKGLHGRDAGPRKDAGGAEDKGKG